MLDMLVEKLIRWKVVLNYKWSMSNAYLTQFYAPTVSAQWEREADSARMELWRMERSLR